MNFWTVLTYGFAIFAMFFGSGNLVFPLQIGFISGENWLVGFFGLLLTGIFLPFLGLFVIKLHKGNYNSFFNGAGRWAGLLLPFFTLSLLGSFGVVPRCIVVAHGGISYLSPQISLLVFSIIFCFITYVFCLKDQVMITIIGKWMSPVLLVSLLGLVAIGIVKAPAVMNGTDASAAFLNGFTTGYQTMDLFAAFFFSALIFKQIQLILPAHLPEREVLKYAITPSIVGSLMLAIVYVGLVFLGSHYAVFLTDTAPELMLPTIVTHLIGPSATFIIAIAMIFSCLTTAVALNNIYAHYISSIFKLHDNKFPIVLCSTTMVSFAMSMLDFRGIAAFLAPTLEVSYPGLIALTATSIFLPHHRRVNMYTFWAITFISAIYYFSSFLL